MATRPSRKPFNPVVWATAAVIVVVFGAVSWRIVTSCEPGSFELLQHLKVTLGGCPKPTVIVSTGPVFPPGLKMGQLESVVDAETKAFTPEKDASWSSIPLWISNSPLPGTCDCVKWNPAAPDYEYLQRPFRFGTQVEIRNTCSRSVRLVLTYDTSGTLGNRLRPGADASIHMDRPGRFWGSVVLLSKQRTVIPAAGAYDVGGATIIGCPENHSATPTETEISMARSKVEAKCTFDKAFFDQTLKNIEYLVSPARRDQEYSMLAYMALCNSDYRSAKSLADKISTVDERDAEYRKIVKRMITAGDLTGAEKMTESLQSPFLKDDSRKLIAEARKKGG